MIYAITTAAYIVAASSGVHVACYGASWYGPGFHGRMTASGERFNQNALTAAHRTYAFGTRLRVTNRKNGKSVVVRVNDRGPFIRGRSIDLSRGAASRIGMIGTGTACVRIDKLR